MLKLINRFIAVLVLDVFVAWFAAPSLYAKELYIVSVAGPIHSEWRQGFQGMSVEIGDYLGNSDFLIAVPRGYDTQTLLSFPRIISVSALRPETKLDSSLRGTSNVQRLEIHLWPTADSTSIVEQILSWGGNCLSVQQQRLVAEIAVTHLEELAARNDVTFIRLFHPPQIQTFLEEVTSLVGVSALWNDPLIPFRGAGEIIAVNDVGVDQTHFALVNAIVPPVIDVAGDNDLNDVGNHGTHVSGVIASRGLNNQHLGIAPEVKLVVQAMWNNQKTSMTISEPASNIFQTAMARGAAIQNNSWGVFNAGQYSTLSFDVDEFVRANPEATLVFAAGSGGDVAEPAIVKNAIAVGEIGGVYNATTDGCRKPDVFAPSSAVSNALVSGRLQIDPAGNASAASEALTATLYFQTAGFEANAVVQENIS